ncbi:MAG: MBL fold metallo-hydrolase [Clostridia bacterium]|nr:MBL fold metallo-hydrolase [Clostridia bacterium]
MKNTNKKASLALKLICAALIVVFCMLGAVACTGNGGDTNNGTEPTAGTTAPQVPPITLASDGEAKVRVLYNAQGGNVVISTAKAISSALSELSGVTVVDSLDMLSSKNPADVEILVGDTSYDESKAALSALAPNSYSITVVGNKIVVVSNNVYLYAKAVEDLVAAISVNDGTMTVASNLSKSSESFPVITLATNRKTEYAVIYAAGDDTAKAQATAIKNAFFSVGVSAVVAPDTSAPVGKEILIGDTNRPLSANSEAYYLNSHSRCDENGNLSITGNIESGVADLIKYIEDIARSGSNISIPQYLFGFITPAGYGNAPEYEGSGTVTLFENHEKSKSYYVQAADATKKDYTQYITKLESAGFERYYSTEAQDSLFSIYTDGYNIVNLSYLEYEDPFEDGKDVQYINIAIECTENTALPPLVDNGERITTTQLTMTRCDMAFIFRLEDGRFVVIDGGVNESAPLMYEQMVAQNVRGGNPVIAAWFITHHHGDHVGGTLKMLADYKGRLDIERVVTNTPGQGVLHTITDGVDYEYGWINSMFSSANSNFPNADIIMAHAGQRFVFAGLTVDVLITPENFYQKDLSVGNEEVCMYRFETERGSMVFTGDAQATNCKIAMAIYAEDLESDVVQYAHHGARGGDVDFYATIGATYGIWTNSYEAIVEGGKYGQYWYNGVDPSSPTLSVAPTNTEDVMILTEDMTFEELDKYIRFRVGQ